MLQRQHKSLKRKQVILVFLGNEKLEPVLIFKSTQHLKCRYAISLWAHHSLGPELLFGLAFTNTGLHCNIMHYQETLLQFFFTLLNNLVFIANSTNLPFSPA